LFFAAIDRGGYSMAKKPIIPIPYPKNRNELDVYLRSVIKDFKIDVQVKITEDVYKELLKPIHQNISPEETIVIASAIVQALITEHKYAKKRKRKRGKKRIINKN